MHFIKKILHFVQIGDILNLQEVRSMINNYSIEKKMDFNNNSYNVHMHNLYEINFLLTDGVDVLVNDTMYTSKCGDIFIFPPFSFHRVNFNHVHYNRFLMYFSTNAISKAMGALTPALNFLKNTGINVIHLREDEIAEMTTLLENAFSTQDKHGLFSDFNNLCAFGNILSFMISKVDMEKCLNPVKEHDNDISKILSYITENIAEELTIESICNEFNISKTTLWSMIKNATGISTKEYILKKRISLAMDLLINDMSVTEVSNRCGFNSYAHFIRTFTKIVGVSPYKYGKRSSYVHDSFIPDNLSEQN